jgi:hypothetical protein
MTIERVRPIVFRLTLHAYELSALVAAGRWMIAAAAGDADVPADTVKQLQHVLASYDREIARLGSGQQAENSVQVEMSRSRESTG